MSQAKKMNKRSFNDYDGSYEFKDGRHVQHTDMEKRVKLAVSAGTRTAGTSTTTTADVAAAMNERIHRECYSTEDAYRALMKARKDAPGVVRYLGHGKWQFRGNAVQSLRNVEWIDISKKKAKG